MRLQLVITAILCLVWGLSAGPMAAAGAAIGGGIATALTLYMAAKLLTRSAEDSPEAFLSAVMRAEIAKFALTGVLVTVAVLALPGQAAAMATTLAAALSAYWLALLGTRDRND
jgi:F0F1-type ATP synthase assembly protein I